MRNGPYELVTAPPEYPGKRYRGRYVYEHHLVWWQTHGSVVSDGAVVHHRNGDKRDNRVENLELLTRVAHAEHHGLEKTADAELPFTCSECGGAFMLLASKANTRKRQNTATGNLFCSRKCAAKGRARREMKHGTSSAYGHHGCRCATCRAGQAERQRKRREKKRSEEATAGL